MNHSNASANGGTKKVLLSTREACAEWGISRYALRRLVEDETIIPVVLGDRNWKFHPDDFDDIIALKKRF